MEGDASNEPSDARDIVFQLLDLDATDEPVDRVASETDTALFRIRPDWVLAIGDEGDDFEDDDQDDDDDSFMDLGDDDDDDGFADLDGGAKQKKRKKRAACVVHLFGRTKDGRSVYAEVRGFRPFFFAEMPEESTQRECESLARFLEKRMRLRKGQVRATLERRKRMYGWVPSPATATEPAAARTRLFPFARLTFPTTDHKRWASNILAHPVLVPGMWGARRSFDVSEARNDDAYKFCDAMGISPSSWIGVRASMAVRRDPRDATRRSHCGVEVSCTPDAVYACPEETDMAPFRLASWDIECTSPSGNFPDQANEHDRVIQIGTVSGVFGSDDPVRRIVFCLGRTDPVEGVEIRCFEDEGAMIVAWRDYVVEELEADVLIGYNISRFDRRYLAERMMLFHDREQRGPFFRWSRLREKRTPLEKSDFSSDAYGDSENYVMNMLGRIELDMYTWIKREKKLVSYSLNHVSKEILDDCKNDLPPKMIFKRYSEGPEGRAEVASYCAKDCDLPLRLLMKLEVLANLFAMSRVTITSARDVLSRGQQIRVLNQILVTAHQEGFVVNRVEVPRPPDYQGATVLDATGGFYDFPIATLDFQSLYPSIIRRWRLCYSNLVLDPKHQDLPGVEYRVVEIPGGRRHVFVQHLPGVLPMILTKLLEERGAVRRQMAKETDEFTKSLLNGKQLALKVSANSVYGFTAANLLPCLALAESVTALGRDMIDQTKRYIESRFDVRRVWGPDPPAGIDRTSAEVLYGDTDSVMVRFPVTKDDAGIRKTFEIAEVAAKEASDLFGGVVRLEFEKVYMPYLLLRKKRYAGLKYTRPDEEPEKDVKGMDVVRRDTWPHTKSTCNAILDALLYRRSVEEAKRVLQESMEVIVACAVPFDDCVLHKALKKEYKKPDTQAHLAVVRKMRARDPGSEPKIGDRVPFVIVETPDPGAKFVDKTEDPVYAKENALRLDMLYYFEHNFVKAITKVLEPFVPDPDALFAECRIKLSNSRKRQRSLMDMLPVPSEDARVRPPAPTCDASPKRSRVAARTGQRTLFGETEAVRKPARKKASQAKPRPQATLQASLEAGRRRNQQR